MAENEQAENASGVKPDPRHPYTHAADFLRMAFEEIQSKSGQYDKGLGVVMSRSEASQLRTVIADAIGLSDEDLAERFSIAFLKATGGPSNGE